MDQELLMTLDQKVDPRSAAIIVIDVQNDFVADDGWAAGVGWDPKLNQAAAQRLARFLDLGRQAQIPIIFIQAIYDDIYLGAPMRERNKRRGVEGGRCLSGTWGADFYLVAPRPGEPVVRKHRYSAFAETDLNTVLRHLGVKSLLLTGVYTEGCVESTARDGYFLDYYITLVEDCCGTTTTEIHEGVLERCERDWGTVFTSREIVDAWSRMGAVSATPVAG